MNRFARFFLSFFFVWFVGLFFFFFPADPENMVSAAAVGRFFGVHLTCRLLLKADPGHVHLSSSRFAKSLPCRLAKHWHTSPGNV